MSDRVVVYVNLFDGHQFAGKRYIEVRDGVLFRVSEERPEGPVEELDGFTATPGFVDGHLHYTQYAESLDQLDLRGLEGKALEAAVRARHRELERSDCLIAFGLPAVPTARRPRDLLEEWAPGRPTALWTADAHRLLLSSSAIERFDLDQYGPPDGGEAVRDEQGLTGLFAEAAAHQVALRFPKPGPDQVRSAYARAAAELFRRGITGVVTFERRRDLDALQNFLQSADVPLTVRVFRYADEMRAEDRPEVWTERARVVGAKWFLDGTLSSETAWLKEPYEGTGWTGLSRFREALKEDVQDLLLRGFIPSFHAIGDAAVCCALDLLATCGGRIEHLQLVDPEDYPLVGPKIISSVQPCHLVSDRLAVGALWGERAGASYPYRSLLAQGSPLVFGSDAPVSDPDPLLSLKMAVHRKVTEDEPAFFPIQRIPVDKALEAFAASPMETLDHGWSPLALGAPANLVIWEGDLSQPRTLFSTRPLLTLAGGRLVHRA